MLFSRSGSQKTEQFSLYLNDRVLKRVDKFKYLGIILDENLSFREHVKTMSLKISRNVGILSRLRHVFPRNILKTIYFSFVNPYFLYCVSVWASTFPSTFQPLQTLQNKALRLMFNVNNRSSVSHLYGSSGFLSVHQHHFIAISNICHNYVFGQLSLNFPRLFPTNSQFHNYPTSHSSDFSFEIRATVRSGFSLCHIGPKVWNLIPIVVRNCNDRNKFLKLLRNHVSSLP